MATHSAGHPAGQAPVELPNLLYEQAALPPAGLPSTLATAYGGDLGFTEPCVYANFVASLDGVVALGPQYPSSGSAISGGEPADRFVMGLLRAFADVVLIGAGTLRASAGHRWTPEHVYPAAAADFAELRGSRGRTAGPELAVVTATGDVPTGHPGLEAGALILTTKVGARLLDERLPATCTVVVLGVGPVLRMADVLRSIRDRGHTMVLSEGGPRLFGHLVRDRLADELFLTLSPVIAGRADTSRPGLVTGLELLPSRRESAELVSLRRCASYLFLRYRLRRVGHLGADYDSG
ncbi:dihydrofolate reductase family protein [Nonomuraea sp. NPDC049269]|uniref:dihydrofolate reductase family protein n=1 Tax=Nonomuraea sp. NPDC049269 TaxID=3364349 RepID=UPI00371071FF